jgi:type 1 glutamine amidotransferase
MPEHEIKLLLLVGGPHHDREGAREALLEAIHAGRPPGCRFDVELTDDLSILTSSRLERFAVIANYTTSQPISLEQASALLRAVETGTGFAGIHGATVTFRESEQYNDLVGSSFTHHPKHGEVTVRITAPDHSITRGLSDFAVPDELYVIQGVGCDFSRYRVLATAEASGRADPAEMRDGVQPCTYVKTFGRGRVFYTSLGHDARCFVSEHVRTLLGWGMAWAARGSEGDGTDGAGDHLADGTGDETRA